MFSECLERASEEEEEAVLCLTAGKELCLLILKGERGEKEEEEQMVGRGTGRQVSWKIGMSGAER